MSESVLEISDLVVEYRRGRAKVRAVDGVSLTVAPGETVGLVGESGSGKSTIAKAVLGLAPVTAGTIRFEGQEISGLRGARRKPLARRLQAVFQDPNGSLNPTLTIGRTLAEPMLAQGGYSRSAIDERVTQMLDQVGLTADAATRYPAQFSGGQKQRIGIARALMLTPSLVICDEVVSALDLSIQAQVLNLLQDLQARMGLSLLFISHDLEVIRHLCDRTVVLYRGEIVESGPTQQIATAPRERYTQLLLAASPIPDPRAQRDRRAARLAVATTPLP